MTLIARQADGSTRQAQVPGAAAIALDADARWTEWSERYARDDRRTHRQVRIAVAILVAASGLVWALVSMA